MSEMSQTFLATRMASATGVLAALMVLAAPAAASTMSTDQPQQPARPHYVQLAGLFGESDEEIAARRQREQAQDASIANLTQRVSDLEHALRQATGQIEEANHQNAMLEQKIDRMKKEFDYKLCQIAAQQLGASSDGGDGSGNALPCGGSGGQGSQWLGSQQGSNGPPPSPSSASAAAPPQGPQMGQPSGVLGTLPKGTPMPRPRQHNDVTVNMSAVGGAPSSGAGGDETSGGHAARAQFDSAMNLLAKAQYDEARAAFHSFADSYPKDDLAPQAVYWVGAIAYVQKDFPGAARAFARELKEYPSSPRAPESMLKLGQSLIAMKQKQEGCTTLGALRSKYPKASRTIHREAEKARREARCR